MQTKPPDPTRKSPNTWFDYGYSIVLEDCLAAKEETDKRTGKKMKRLHSVHFHELGLPLLTLRDINPFWACVEASWFLAGRDDVAYFEKFGFKNWTKFADEEGRVHAAAGKRWGAQLDAVFQILRHDQTARRGVLCAWDPMEDLARKHQPPCVPMVHLVVIDGKLCLSGFQRSADLFYGLPHDVAGYGIIQAVMAAALELEAGELGWYISDAHLYEDQYAAAQEMVDRARLGGGEVPNFRFVASPSWWERMRAPGSEASRVMPWAFWHEIEGQYARMNKGPLARPPITV